MGFATGRRRATSRDAGECPGAYAVARRRFERGPSPGLAAGLPGVKATHQPERGIGGAATERKPRAHRPTPGPRFQPGATSPGFDVQATDSIRGSRPSDPCKALRFRTVDEPSNAIEGNRLR